MSLVNMRDMLRKARDGGYAVGAFNILDYNSMRAVVEAAAELGAPVIVQTSPKVVSLWGRRPLAAWIRELAGESNSPVAFHLDHCRDVEFIQACIEAGWSSVMFDGSTDPFEENLRKTARVVAMAGPRDVSVEAELGVIGTVGDDTPESPEECRLADPDTAVSFCRQVRLDCFAPAVGTAHGMYRGEPVISFSRLGEIAGRLDVPLALHGGTGLSEETFHRCISLGCAKVNISTGLKHAFIDSFAGYHREHHAEYDPLRVLTAQFEAIRRDVRAMIELFGSAGKAT